MIEGMHPDVEAALTYAERFRRGLPSDRWTDGHVGAVATARGIELLAAEIIRLRNEEVQRGRESMSLGEKRV